MTKEDEELFAKIFDERLSEVRLAGLTAGAKGISGAILEMCNSGKPAAEIVNEIRQMCETGLGLNKK